MTTPVERTRATADSLDSARWLPYRRPLSAPALRVFCFPFAGAAASFYGAWQQALAPGVELCSVQLPGREQRFRERPFTRMTPLVDVLFAALRPLFDCPCVFFGHSVGGKIAYALAYRMLEERVLALRHLVVSGSCAPHRPRGRSNMHALPDEALITKLRRLNGSRPQILQEPEIMRQLLPTVRADLEINETYSFSPATPLDAPISALGGREDYLARESDLTGWGELTHGPFNVLMFDGGHFFVSARRKEVFVALARTLAP